MLKGQLVKCNNIIIGKQITCKIIDKYDNNLTTTEQYEVQIQEGQFKGQYATVKAEDIIADTIKATAKIDFTNHTNYNDYEDIINDRCILAYITVTSNNNVNAELVLDNIIDKMESKYQFEFNKCYELADNQASDSFNMEFEYGKMNELKKEAKQIFKEIKKELGIR